MSKWSVLRVTGDYRDRQAAANAAGAKLYLEQHVNSSAKDYPDYALGVVATNASQTSIAMARWYAARAGTRFDVGGPDDADVGYGNGVRIGGNGNANLYYTDAPAAILEPWFASNPAQARMMATVAGVEAGAKLLAELVREFLPEGGLVALSVGHIGKTSAPRDRGAKIVTGGWEADWSMAVVDLAHSMLEHEGPSAQVDETNGDGVAVIRIAIPGRPEIEVPVARGVSLRVV